MEPYGIALGGGGTRGSYELGVWRYLLNHNIPYDTLVGTSIGSINAAYMAQGDYLAAREAWFTMGLHTLLEMSEEELAQQNQKHPFFRGMFKDIPALAQAAKEKGGLSLEPLRDMLQNTLSEEAVRASGVRLGIVTVNLSTFKPVVAWLDDIPEGQLFDYILASCSLPIFKPTQIGDDSFIDGAFHDNVPVKPLIDRGHQRIIAVDLSGFAPLKSVRDATVPVVHIKNSEDLGPILSFDRSTVRRNMRMGYLDAARAFGDCLGRTYYIRPEPETPLLKPFSAEEVSFLIEALNRTPLIRWDGRWALRKLRKDLEQKTTGASVEKYGKSGALIVAALEITARQLEVERLEFYTPDKLIRSVLAKYRTLLSNHPLGDKPELLDVLWERLRSKKDEDRPTLRNMLPELVERAGENDRSLLFHFMAITLPRTCITVFFLLLMKQRVDRQDDY